MTLFDSFEFAFEALQRPGVAHGTPDRAADGGEDEHVDAVRAALAEARVGALLVLDVQHDGRVGDVAADVFRRDARVGCRAHDVLHRAVRVGAVFHHHAGDDQDEMHLVNDLGEGMGQDVFFRGFHEKLLS